MTYGGHLRLPRFLDDDHIRVSWVYLQKEKSEVGEVFKIFTLGCKHNSTQVFRYFEVMMGKNISTKFWNISLCKKGLYIKVLAMILLNEME